MPFLTIGFRNCKKTIASWISVLESSFVVHLLKPHHTNFNKRLVKMPKLYLYDTGLACSLLGVHQIEQLNSHPLKGSLFENHVINDLIKERYNKNEPLDLYSWGDNTGNEMDVVMDSGVQLYPIEIKAGKTITSDYFKNFQFWKKITGFEGGTVIYAGNEVQKRSNGIQIIRWNDPLLSLFIVIPDHAGFPGDYLSSVLEEEVNSVRKLYRRHYAGACLFASRGSNSVEE